jgi:hypothetical protein
MTENRELTKELRELKVLTTAIHSQLSCSSLLAAPAAAVRTVARAPLSDRQQTVHLEQLTSRAAVTTALVVPNIPPHDAPAPAIVPTCPPALDSSPAAPLEFTSNSIVIRNKIILYDRNILVAPPHRDYSADPDLLASDWEHLEISLHPGQIEDIGVKFWKQLYKGTKHWARLRKKYSNWAVRAAAWMTSVIAFGHHHHP